MRFLIMNFFISLLVSSLLIGCTNTLQDVDRSTDANVVDKAQDFPDDDASQIARASCQFPYSNGRSYGLLKSQVVEGAFQKKFDEGKLKAVLRSSPESIVLFAKTLNVQFYKSGRHKQSSCAVLAPLPQAPYDLDSYLEEIDSEGNLLGLYLPLNSPELPSTETRAGIIVREDVTKWTLIHELMHHLFRSQSDLDHSDGDVSEQLASSAEQLEQAKIDFQTAFAEEALQIYAQKYIDSQGKYAEALEAYLKSFSLEEVAIEERLVRAFDAAEMTEVLEGQKINSAAYTIQASERAFAVFNDLDELNRSLEESLNSELTVDRTQFERAMARFEFHRQALLQISSKAKIYLQEKAWRAGALSGVSPQRHLQKMLIHKDCPHSLQADKLYDKISKRLSGKKDR